MSIILGALGGAGEALQQIGARNQQADLALQNATAENQQRSDLETQRQQTMEVFKNNLQMQTANQLRTAQTARIDAAASAIAQPAIDQKRGIIQSAIEDRDNWTPEQQAAVDQSLALDQKAAIADPKTRMQAAISTGDISPEKAATMGQNAEISQMKLDSMLQRAEDKNATAKQIADIRAEAMLASAQLRVDAANQRAMNGKIDTATGRMLITSEDANIKASTSQLNMLNTRLGGISKGTKEKPNPEYTAIMDQMEELRTSIKQSQETKAQYLKDMGLMRTDGGKSSSSSSTTDAPLPSGLPSGSVQIGTSNGKPVYQSPDGKRFTVQ